VRLEDYIQDIPDFPKPGIVFKDITPLFLDADALAYTVARLGDWAREWEADYVASGAGFILARKPGKLPREVSSVEYELEYGVDALEIHSDAVRNGARVLVHDDLLATGGTAGALCDLVEQAGGVVAGCAFVIELGFLNGRDRLRDHEVRSLVVVHDE